MTETTPLAALVRDAIACVDGECPLAAREMRAALAARVVLLDVGTESFPVSLAPTSEPCGSLSVATTSAVLYAVLAGDRDPLDAILENALAVRGAAADLEALSRAALFFVKGAVRCPSMDGLMNRLKRISDETGERQ